MLDPTLLIPQFSGKMVAYHGFSGRLDQKKSDCKIIIFNPNDPSLDFDNGILILKFYDEQYLFIGFRWTGSPFEGTPFGGNVFQQRFTFIIGGPIGNRFFTAPETESRALRLLVVLIVLQESIKLLSNGRELLKLVSADDTPSLLLLVHFKTPYLNKSNYYVKTKSSGYNAISELLSQRPKTIHRNESYFSSKRF